MRTLKSMKFIVALLMTILTTFIQVSAQQQQGLLWQISGKNLSRPAYLFGTIHIYDSTLYEVPKAPFGLLDKVDKVYFEMDYGKIDPVEMSKAFFITDRSQYVNALLDVESLAKLDKMIDNSDMAKMFGERIYSVKPILLFPLLTTVQGKSTALDMELYTAALARHQVIGGLETLNEEMQAIDGISIPAQIIMLKQALASDRSGDELLVALTTAYTTQDGEQLTKALNHYMPTDLNADDLLRLKRNYTMAEKIDSVLQKETPLIAIGAAHLWGTTGLVEMLRKKGYTLTSIPFTIKKAHQ